MHCNSAPFINFQVQPTFSLAVSAAATSKPTSESHKLTKWLNVNLLMVETNFYLYGAKHIMGIGKVTLLITSYRLERNKT